MKWSGAVAVVAVMTLVCASSGAQTALPSVAVDPPQPTRAASETVGESGMGVRGKPYSLVETMSKVLPDGRVVATRYEERHMRDSEGRTRLERGWVKGSQFVVQEVLLLDPATNTRTEISVSARSAIVIHLPKPMPSPEWEARMAAGSEDLPPETIAGIYATGKRRTMIVPADREGNDREIHVTQDMWTSPDLKVMMRSASHDPRLGELQMVVTELKRNEPDPTLFRIPADYKLTDQAQ